MNAEQLLLIINPKVPALLAGGVQDWRSMRPLADDVAEFGWAESMKLPEVQRLIDRANEVLGSTR